MINTLMMDHEIDWCKKIIASGITGEDLKHANERLKRAEAAKKAALEQNAAEAAKKAARKK